MWGAALSPTEKINKILIRVLWASAEGELENVNILFAAKNFIHSLWCVAHIFA